MKKLFFILFFTSLLFVSTISSTQAQFDNKFNCIYDFSNESCEPDYNNSGCGPGTEVVASVCTEVEDENTCLEKTGNDCRVIEIDEEEQVTWACIEAMGGCQPAGTAGIYADLNSCQAACSGPVTEQIFKCKSTGIGCDLCTEEEIASDPACALIYSDCENSCNSSQPFYSCRASDKSCIECENETDAGCMPLSQCQNNCKPIGQQFEVVCTENFGRGIDTALGCIPLETKGIVTTLLLTAFSMGGGLSFLLIIFAGYQISSSQGDPRKLEGGKELLGAAIGGIIMLVFSLLMLRILGVNILGIF